MRKIAVAASMLLSLLGLVCIAPAGEIDAPAPPDDPASAMPTVEDLFLRLTEGSDFTLREAFVEPTEGPAGTGYSLVDLMNVAPAADDADGATADEVVAGRTFWGLRTDGGGWGFVTGTMDSQSIDPATTMQVGGIYGAFDLAVEDPDLVADNIRGGVVLYGIEGAAAVAAGNAAPEHVLDGRTFSNDGGAAIGVMPDNGAVLLVPTTTDQSVAAGFHDGAGLVQGDADLEPENIRSGVEIFGVAGELNPSCSCEGTADGDRWCDNLDGTVTDLTTCLLWLRRADWGQIHPWTEGETSVGAHSRASSLKPGDLGAYLSDGSDEGDWRLPTKREAEWLVDGPEPVSVVTPRAFVGITETNYWTSAGSVSYPDLAWTIGPETGLPALAPKVSTYNVWPVRSAQ